MGESVFEVVKQSVTARGAAELYGIAVGRGGMACCPFHDDRHPSMKVDTRFHCFGCGADGDVIDFTARLYDLSPKEAAEKLAQDFGLSYDSKALPRRSYVRQKSEAQVRKEKREHGWRVLTDYYHLLRKWEADYSPRTPDEDPHPRFLEAVQKKEYMGYLLDTFLDSSTEEQDQWIAEHTTELSAIERRVKIMTDKPTNRERLQQITAGIEQGIKELFESEKYMRYLSVMSRFHRYSVNNTMLIYITDLPDGTFEMGTLVRFAGYSFLTSMPVLSFMLLISSRFENMWIPLGVGVAGFLSGMALASSNLAVLMVHPFVLMLKPAVAMSAQPDMTVSAVSLIETVLFLAIALWLAKSKRYE
mgnify:CR=1 FL=1